MGRGGGGGGGSRGGRSSGGSRGGSFRSSSSGGRGRSYSSSRGSSGYRATRPYYGGVHRHYHYGYSGSFNPLAFIITTMFIILIVVAVLHNNGAFAGSGITKSTIEREKLAGQYVDVVDDWYDDSSMNWISSGYTLENGPRDFYNETGVQPYLVITDEVNGNYAPSGQQVFEYANQVYDEMFTDEGHMVFVFQCPDGGTDYNMAACTGAQAKAVVDDEALEILYDYLDYYFYSDLDEDEMFAKAFEKAGERIMHKDTPIIVYVLAVAGIGLVVFAICFVVRTKAKRAKEEAAETERILKTPIHKIGDTDPDLEDLKNKYD